MTHELIRVTDPPVFGVPMWICRCGAAILARRAELA